MNEQEIKTEVQLKTVALSPSMGSVLPLEDGRLLWVWGSGGAGTTGALFGAGIDRSVMHPVYASISDDAGRSWSDSKPLKLEAGGEVPGVFNVNLVRMKSRGIGLGVETKVGQVTFFTSSDEGDTWSTGVDVNPEYVQVSTTGDKAIVLENGRIIYPVYSGHNPKMESEDAKHRIIEGDRFSTTIYSYWYVYSYHSDDEGKTWERSENETYGILDGGMRGIFGVGEPMPVELKDGRIMMLLRSDMGRFFRTYSKDQGKNWTISNPVTSLICSPCPPCIRRIPDTRGLLLIWNQISYFEGVKGYYRHRLTCAVSEDDGETWGYYKNLESLDDTTYITPGEIKPFLQAPFAQPTDRKRYHRAPGPLRMSYPTLTFWKDLAVITYGVSVLGTRDELKDNFAVDLDELTAVYGYDDRARGNRVRVLPVDWFYT